MNYSPDPHLIVRPAARHEAASLVHIEMAASGLLQDSARELQSEWHDRLNNLADGERILVAEQEGYLIGFCLAIDWEIDVMCVLPQFADQGIEDAFRNEVHAD